MSALGVPWGPVGITLLGGACQITKCNQTYEQDQLGADVMAIPSNSIDDEVGSQTDLAACKKVLNYVEKGLSRALINIGELSNVSGQRFTH